MGLESPANLPRRWTLGPRNSGQSSPAKTLAKLDPIAGGSPQGGFQRVEDVCELLPLDVALSSRRPSRQWILPPLDGKADTDTRDFCPVRRLKGCRGTSEYLARQSSRREATEVFELNFVKEAFLRFRSDSAEINVSDLRDVLDHLGYMGITDESAASLAKEVSRFSTLDFQELQQVTERAGSWEHEQIQRAFEKQATGDEGHEGSFVPVDRLQLLLHDLGATSEGQAVLETLEAMKAAPPEPSPPGALTEDAPPGMMSFYQVNRFLAMHRAAQCCSQSVLESAETLFNSVAHRGCRRPEVSIHKVPELLGRLFESGVSASVSELCHRLGSHVEGADSDVSGDEGALAHPPSLCMTFVEFLTWLRRLRCMELRKNWQKYLEVACSPGCVPADALDSLVPDWPAEPERRDAFLTEVGLVAGSPLRFDVVDCLRRHCCLMKDFTTEEARYFTGVFAHFESEDYVGFVDRADCLCLFRYMGYGLKGDEIYSLLLDAKATGHRLLSLSDFLNMMRACRVRETGMLKTAYEMNAQDMGLSDLSDFEETGSGLSMSDEEELCELVLSRRQSNDCSRAAFRRRSSVNKDGQSKQQVKGEGLVVPSGALEALGAVGWSLDEQALYEALARINLSRNLLSLTEFQSLAMLLREEEAAQKQRRAGWSASEAADIERLYEAHGGKKSLDQEELERLLWDLDVRKGFGELKQLLDKARMLSGDEPEGSAKVTLSTLMHLLRFISQKGLRTAFGKESEAFHMESCTEADLAGYRDLFRKLQGADQLLGADQHAGETTCDSSQFRRKSESGLAIPSTHAASPTKRRIKKCNSKLRQDYPVIVNKMRSALAVPFSEQQVSGAAVMKFLRRMGHRAGSGDRLSPQQQAELWKKVEELSVNREARDMLNFASFVRIMGWVRRTDFASIRQHSDKVGSFFRLAGSVEG